MLISEIFQHMKNLLAYLLMPTAVAYAGFQMISQKLMQLGAPNLTHKCSMMSSENPFILGSKDQRSQRVSVFRHNAIMPLLLRTWTMLGFPGCCVPNHISNTSNIRFSLHHFPASACWWMLGFPGRGFCTRYCQLLLMTNCYQSTCPSWL